MSLNANLQLFLFLSEGHLYVWLRQSHLGYHDNKVTEKRYNITREMAAQLDAWVNGLPIEMDKFLFMKMLLGFKSLEGGGGGGGG